MSIDDFRLTDDGMAEEPESQPLDVPDFDEAMLDSLLRRSRVTSAPPVTDSE